MTVVKDLIDDISLRIGDIKHNAVRVPSILIAMNHIYQNVNEELRSLDKKLEIPVGTFASQNTYDLPDDWIEPFIINGADSNSLYNTPTFIPKEQWNEESYSGSNVFTVLADQLIFGDVDEASAFDIYYYSSGYTLVNKEDGDLSDGEINIPEWKTRFHRLLVYLTCLEISPDYPFLQRDIISAQKLKSELKRFNKNRQRITPEILGGIKLQRRKQDPDYVDGMPVTRF